MVAELYRNRPRFFFHCARLRNPHHSLPPALSLNQRQNLEVVHLGTSGYFGKLRGGSHHSNRMHQLNPTDPFQSQAAYTYIHTHTHTHPEDSVNNDFIFPISTIPYLFVPLNPSGCRDLQEKRIKARNGALLIYLFIPRLVPDGILGGSLRWTM